MANQAKERRRVLLRIGEEHIWRSQRFIDRATIALPEPVCERLYAELEDPGNVLTIEVFRDDG